MIISAPKGIRVILEASLPQDTDIVVFNLLVTGVRIIEDGAHDAITPLGNIEEVTNRLIEDLAPRLAPHTSIEIRTRYSRWGHVLEGTDLKKLLR
jgi:hypothetical protein